MKQLLAAVLVGAVVLVLDRYAEAAGVQWTIYSTVLIPVIGLVAHVPTETSLAIAVAFGVGAFVVDVAWVALERSSITDRPRP